MNSRQEAILEAIVREYVTTGVPVGSLFITDKYSFPFSPATVRAEMSELERLGYLASPHTSAGRIPTERGYRYFVDMIESEKKLLYRRSQAAKKRIGSFEDNFGRRLDSASQVLSEITQNMGFAGTIDEIYSHGLGNLFSYPELLLPDRALKTAELIDNLSYFLRELPADFETRAYIGSEVPIGKTAGCSVVVTRFISPDGRRGYLGVVGPTRMSYEENLSALKEIKNIMETKNDKKR